MEEPKKSGFKEFYKNNKKKFDFFYMILICLILAKLLTTFVFLSVVVDGNSMAGTLKNGDKGITDGLFYKVFGIDRFDIVIIDHQSFDEKIVKRVIGLPGETIKYEKGNLYVDGKKVEEKFISEEVAKQTILEHGNDTFEIVLKENEYYVLGDNRGNSTDSRRIGPVKKNQIKGKGIMLFGSCDSISKNGKCVGLDLDWPKIIK